MYLPTTEFPLAAALEHHWRSIRAEMTRLRMADYEPIADDLVVSGRWAGLGLCDRLDPARHERWRVHTAACPTTVAMLGRIAGLHVAGFLLMTPGTRLRPHADLQDPRFLNFMVALSAGDAAWMRVGRETRVHADGHCVVFDPRSEHEAGNDGPRDRVTFYAAVAIESARQDARALFD